MTSIKKTSSISRNANLAILTAKWQNKSAYGLDENTAAFISKELNGDKKNISFNYLGRVISVIIIDPKKDQNAVQESLRKNGTAICDGLNASKGEEITVYNDNVRSAYVLALAEGIALSNYQFIKHKPTAQKK